MQPDGMTSTRTVAYAFDLANRLTGESGTDGAGRSYSKSYNLDNAGNRLASSYSLDGQLQAQTSYAYNSLDWLTNTSVQSQSGTNSTSYGYDANGAQTSQTTVSGTSAQTWDFEGNLRAQGQVDASGNWNGPRNTYNYDASGMRLTQAAFNAAGTLTSGTSYVWNGDRVAEERDASGVLQGVYEHGQELGPLRLRRLKDGAWQNRFFVGDGQDSTRQLMNEAGLVTDSYFYDSFGNALNGGQGVTNNSFKYTGQQQDSNGLYYLRARYYNAGTGRFLSQDPEMGAASDPISMHRYLYASGDPTNFSDPSGRESMGEMMSVNAMQGILIAAAGRAVVGGAVGGLVGAGMAGVDRVLQDPSHVTPQDVMNAQWEGFVQGAKFGAVGGALGPLRIAQYFFLGLGAYYTAQGTGQAISQGNYALAAWRAGTFLALVAASHAYKSNPTPGNLQAEQIAESQADLADAEEFAADPDSEVAVDETQCFVAGTQVTMGDGKIKSIEHVKVGDRVLSRDPKTGRTSIQKVKRTFEREVPSTIVLHFSNGERIETTEGHRFYVRGRGFVHAGELGIGTSIVTRAGPSLQLEKVERKDASVTVYNFEVENTHTYFVGQAELWVHNRGCSTTLRRNMGTSNVKDAQAQHLLPSQLETYNQFMDDATDGGFDINEADNGMMLPDNEADSNSQKLPMHKGSHPGYTEAVRLQLDILDNQRATQNWDAARCAQEVRSLCSRQRTLITNMGGGVTINGRTF